MSSGMVMERTNVGVPSVGVPGVTTGVTTPTGVPSGAGWMMIPRCTLKLEKCTGGLKLTCVCDDKVSGSMVQNLCTMLAGGMCSCCVMMNGITVCTCNLTMGLCKVEATENGVCFTCASGDSHCCDMIQSCCDCVSCMLEAGCTCCVLLNNTPVCCGQSECKSSKSKK